MRQLVGPPLRPQVRSRPPSASVPPGIAHKGGNYATLGRTQGLDPALVCGSCFLNRGPCVRTPRGGARSGAVLLGPALVRAFPRAAGVVDRVHVDRVRSAPGLSAGVSPGSERCRPCQQRARPWRGCPPWRGRALSARARAQAHVVETDARCRHREGVVDIVRGLSTPRGGYNARWCQQRASVPISHAECQQRAPVRTTRAHADNARRRPRPEPRRQSPQSAPGALVGAAQSPPAVGNHGPQSAIAVNAGAAGRADPLARHRP